jgi:hypothetical protein
MTPEALKTHPERGFMNLLETLTFDINITDMHWYRPDVKALVFLKKFLCMYVCMYACMYVCIRCGFPVLLRLALNSWAEVIPLPQSPEQLGPQAQTTASGLLFFFLKTALMSYNSYAIQFKHLKCIIQWLLSGRIVQPSHD